MENTADGDDEYHGHAGPFPIRQRRYEDLTSSMRGFLDAAAAEGFARVEGFNGPDPSGAGGYPINVIDGVRQNDRSKPGREPAHRRGFRLVRAPSLFLIQRACPPPGAMPLFRWPRTLMSN
jgi:choline dehydrogenase-like flavoprotein